MKNKKRRDKKLITYLWGLGVFIVALIIALRKVEEAIIKKQSILTVSLLFNKNQIILLTLLSIVFIILIYKNETEKIKEDMYNFVGWIVYVSITVILIYLIIISSHLSAHFNLLLIIVLFALFILQKRLNKLTK